MSYTYHTTRSEFEAMVDDLTARIDAIRKVKARLEVKGGDKSCRTHSERCAYHEAAALIGRAVDGG